MSTALPKLGSLSQSAREKQLKTARGILLFIGGATIVLNLVMFFAIESQVETEINKQIDALRAQGRVAIPGEVAKFRATVISVARVTTGAAIALGVVFVFFGFVVKKYPVPVTITSLVLYIGAAAVFGFLDPSTLAQGIIIKIIIVFALVKSIQSAIAYERERAHAELNPAAGGMTFPESLE